MIFAKITGGIKKLVAEVEPSNSLRVIESPFPPLDLDGGMRVFRQHLTDDGLVTDGSNQAMNVNGGVTNVDFYVGASGTADRYICLLSFVISDAGQTLNEFANTNAALTNGCRLFYSDDRGEVDIHDSLKTNFQFVRLCAGEPAFSGAGSNPAFRATNVSGTSEGYLPVLDMRRTFGFKWGVRLKKDTSQKITMRIRDDCTAADQFDCIAYGFEREE